MLIGEIDLTRERVLIAEIGNNHEGDPVVAKELADAAVEAGANIIKMQVIEPERLVNVSQNERIAQLRRFRLPNDVLRGIAQEVRRRGRLFMASVFDTTTLTEMLDSLDAIKIASGDLDFDAMLEIAAGSGKPIILSSGMAQMDEIRRSVAVIASALLKGTSIADRLAVLHCVSLYPTPLESANLAAIPKLHAELGVTVGFSDHTLGVEAAIVALSLGARLIEKHFTLNKTRRTFRDHALSAEPAEFALIARVMRSFDALLGAGDLNGELADAATRVAARRSIVAARELAAGTVLCPSDLDYVRPAVGLPPPAASQLIGRRLTTARAMHELIRATDVE